MLIIIILITSLYCILIVSLCIFYGKINHFEPKKALPNTQFSIIIPFRNEAKNLRALLESLEQLEYPRELFEVLCIDDGSDDDSVTIIQRFTNSSKRLKNVSIITNERISNAPKKDAINTGIKYAKHDWILTTDADCIIPKRWLETYNDFVLEANPKMIVAPVTYSNVNTFLDGFQLLDFLSLQTATISGFGLNRPFLCNGANLGYTKNLFVAINGFEGNTNIASGDDIFLLEKALKADSESVHYLKSNQATIRTNPESNFTSLFQQRLRWAAKTSSYRNTFGKIVGLIVLLMNALLIVSLVLSLLNEMTFKYLFVIFSIKFLIDLWCIYKSASFFGQKKHLRYYLGSSFTYPFFSVLVATYATFFGYTWKRRAFRK